MYVCVQGRERIKLQREKDKVRDCFKIKTVSNERGKKETKYVQK